MLVEFQVTGTFKGKIDLPIDDIELANNIIFEKIRADEIILHPKKSEVEDLICSEAE